MYQPTQLRAFLQEMGIRADKRLSQNFLIDGNIIRKITRVAAIIPGDLVLEIGPGPGALTQSLLEAGAHVVAVEKDPPLARALERFQTSDRRLTVLMQDVMEVPIEDVLQSKLTPGKQAKVVANLPYHLTTPILTRLLPLHETLSLVVVMVQKEFAERMVAPPGSRTYGSFTVFLNFHADTHLGFLVSRHCFYPKPKVDSAVVKLALRPPPEVKDQEAFFKLTRTAFSHRRKMLRSAIRELYAPERVEQELIALGFDPEIRPEQLSVHAFLDLLHRLMQ